MSFFFDSATTATAQDESNCQKLQMHLNRNDLLRFELSIYWTP